MDVVLEEPVRKVNDAI